MNPFWHGVIAGFFIGAFGAVFLLAARGGRDEGTDFKSVPGHNGDTGSMAVAVVFLLLYTLFCLWWFLVISARVEEPADRPAFSTAAAEQEHLRLLKKHGLEGDVAVVCRDVLGEYYIRNGRRYKFQ